MVKKGRYAQKMSGNVGDLLRASWSIHDNSPNEFHEAESKSEGLVVTKSAKKPAAKAKKATAAKKSKTVATTAKKKSAENVKKTTAKKKKASLKKNTQAAPSGDAVVGDYLEIKMRNRNLMLGLLAQRPK